MNHLRIITFGLCLGLSSGTCTHVSRQDLEKIHGEPNGLVNNGRRCYANAALQLLAAFFSEEIKGIPRDPQDGNKNLLRDSLLVIVDHINAKEKRSSYDEKVLQAVRALTDFPDIAKASKSLDGYGGYESDFIRLLGEKLNFLPSRTLMRHRSIFSISKYDNGLPEVRMVSEGVTETFKECSFFSFYCRSHHGLFRRRWWSWI